MDRAVIRVGLTGRYKPGWQQRLMKAWVVWKALNNIELELEMVSSTSYSNTPDFPETMASPRQVAFSHYLMLEQQVDLMVYVNSVEMDGWVHGFLNTWVDRKRAGVIWTPPELDDTTPEDELLQEMTGIVFYKGVLEDLCPILHSILAFEEIRIPDSEE